MCGIFCSILKDSSGGTTPHNCRNEIDKFLLNRGPDDSYAYYGDKVSLKGFVLWQQGDTPKRQPIQIDETILLFNGDIYNIDNEKSVNVSDSEWLASKISKCKDDEAILDIFRNIQGPFSFILLQRNKNCIYFGRDCLGRTSLLLESTDCCISISSISNISKCQDLHTTELLPIGIIKINLENIFDHFVFPFKKLNDRNLAYLEEYKSLLGVSVYVKQIINPFWMSININNTVTYNFYELCSMHLEWKDPETISKVLCKEKTISEVLNQLESLLSESVKSRVQKTPNRCKKCIRSNIKCEHSKIGILFSGGVDSSILAVLAHKYVSLSDSIDLLNVAFEHPFHKTNNWDVPDRVTARMAYQNLLTLCPLRKWNFVEINVKREELLSTLQLHIKHLIHPLKSILDESIGSAFWFASRGLGECENQQFQSSSRVILVGNGADELFGGYTRHRNAFVRCKDDIAKKHEMVEKELELDLQRLPIRNFGRDDRVISDHGRTSRAPFVEENLVNFISNLKSWHKCCFLLDQGVGDKLLLRLFAYKLGLQNISFLKKRAIQFGSRIANNKQKATDTSMLLSN